MYEVLTKGRVTTSYVQNSANTSKVYAESLYLTQDQTRSDVLQSRMYFTEGEDAEVSYSINAEVGNNKVTKYLLYQGTNIVTLTSPKGTIKPGSVFEPETPVYLQVVCENNVKSEAVKTNIFIKSKSSGFIGYDKEASEEFKFGDGVGFTVPGDVPIIGGTEFEYSIGSLPVTITTENDKVKIAVGFTDFKSTDETWDDFTKKIDEACKTADRVDELSKLCKAYGSKSGAFTLKKGWEEPELNIAGYIEATWDESKTKLTSVSGQILGGVDFKYSYNQQFVVGPVPVYFEVGAGFGIEISATVKKVLMETGQIQLDVPIAFTPSFTIGGGAGINGALSVGAEGELSAPVTWDITNQYLQVKGKGSMKLTASLLFVFSAKHEIASYEKTFVDYYYGGNKAASETEDTYKGAAEQQIETLDLNDYEEYEVIDTSYQNKTSGWTGNTLESVRKNGVLVNEDIIMRYVLPGTRPQIATAGDTTVMVFQSNNGNSDETECTSLMYSVLEDGMWTSPQFYKVRDYVNINGTYIYTNYSDSVKAVPQIAPPTSLSAYSTTDGIRLSWSSSSGANSYEIYRSDKENGTYSKIGTASYTSYTDTKVSYNMTYYYKVVAVNGKNKSSMSKPTSYKYALTAPSYVNVYQQNSDTVRVYVSSVSLADGYELYRSTSQNGKYSKVDTSMSSTLFDLNVTLGKQYYYKARAYKTVNNKTYYSAYSTVSSLTISIAAPYFSSVSAAGDTQIYLLWKEVAGADGYEINAADSYYGTYKKIGTTKDISYLHKVNKKDTYVYYKLRAYKKVGKKTIYSEYSNVSSAMSGFAGPYNIKMAFDGKNNAITFGKCAGAAGTEISVRKGYYGDYEVIANTSGTSYQHKDLMKGSYYYYRFRSYKTAGKTKEYSSYRYMSLYTGVQQVEHLKVCLYRRLR